MVKFPTLCSAKEVAKLVNEVGMVPFFKNKIEGFSLEECVHKNYWSEAGFVEGVWKWKGEIIRIADCAYGKLIGGKACFVKKELYSHFANLRRDGYDFDARLDDGLVTRKQQKLYEALEKHGSLLSSEWKEQAGYGWDGLKGFDAECTKLQMLCYVTISGFEYKKDKNGKDYGWGIARYETLENRFGVDFCAEAYKLKPTESKIRIIEEVCNKIPEIDANKLSRMLG